MTKKITSLMRVKTSAVMLYIALLHEKKSIEISI